KSSYSNLAAVPTVEAGDRVAAGDIIGAVGDTAKAESAVASHLHFEMRKADAPVSPLDYLPELR
ncbi:MAG: M23 family metallopeptidase, partial [Pseudoflavonifractor sp.]